MDKTKNKSGGLRYLFNTNRKGQGKSGTNRQIEENQIAYIAVDDAGKENNYVTGRLDDPELVSRLHEANVAGQDEAKEALRKIVDFLYNQGKYKDIGASMLKGV